MTLYQLWKSSPCSNVFVRTADGKVRRYRGGWSGRISEVQTSKKTKYPMYDNVLEVTVNRVGRTK